MRVGGYAVQRADAMSPSRSPAQSAGLTAGHRTCTLPTAGRSIPVQNFGLVVFLVGRLFPSASAARHPNVVWIYGVVLPNLEDRKGWKKRNRDLAELFAASGPAMPAIPGLLRPPALVAGAAGGWGLGRGWGCTGPGWACGG